MHVFVTGGTGFVGANLVAGLNENGIQPRVLHRASSSLDALEGLAYVSIVGDILADRSFLADVMASCDWVFHVAAVADYWRQNTDWLYRVNVEGTKNILAAARAAGVKRLVFTSSLAAMGLPEAGQLLTEDSRFNLQPAQFPYGHSKHLAEAAVQAAVAEGLAAIIVNPAVVLGPRDVNAISGSLILEAARGIVRFTLPGGVNYVAVEDVVAGHIAAAERGRVGERYILAGENISHQEALKEICRVVGRPSPKISIPGWALPLLAWGVAGARLFLGSRVPLDPTQVRLSGAAIYADGSKARQKLRVPVTPFVTAVQQTYDWYKEKGFLAA